MDKKYWYVIGGILILAVVILAYSMLNSDTVGARTISKAQLVKSIKIPVCGDGICSSGETCEIDNCCSGVITNLNSDHMNCGTCGNSGCSICEDGGCLNTIDELVVRMEYDTSIDLSDVGDKWVSVTSGKGIYINSNKGMFLLPEGLDFVNITTYKVVKEIWVYMMPGNYYDSNISIFYKEINQNRVQYAGELSAFDTSGRGHLLAVESPYNIDLLTTAQSGNFLSISMTVTKNTDDYRLSSYWNVDDGINSLGDILNTEEPNEVTYYLYGSEVDAGTSKYDLEIDSGDLYLQYPKGNGADDRVVFYIV